MGMSTRPSLVASQSLAFNARRLGSTMGVVEPYRIGNTSMVSFLYSLAFRPDSSRIDLSQGIRRLPRKSARGTVTRFQIGSCLNQAAFTGPNSPASLSKIAGIHTRHVLCNATTNTPAQQLEQEGILLKLNGEDRETEVGKLRQYPFTEIEAKWQRVWEEQQTFRTPDVVDTSKPKFYALDMFPYPRCFAAENSKPLFTEIRLAQEQEQEFNIPGGR